MTFYDTIGLSRTELDLAWQKASEQDRKILRMLKKHGPMTFYRIHYVLLFRKLPREDKRIEFNLKTEAGYREMMQFLNSPVAIPSVKRSLNTLMQENLIEEIRKKDECLGKPVAVWKLKTENNDWIGV